jgi:holo-[acyl-carrier protein] synthase
MIVGIGTDIIQIDRIKKLFDKYQEAFLVKNFHPKECEFFSNLSQEKSISYLAKRFAGKEAVSKAFGSGIGAGLAFKDIAILNDEFGAPYVEISSALGENLAKNKIHISLSDDYPIAVAFVVISQ